MVNVLISLQDMLIDYTCRQKHPSPSNVLLSRLAAPLSGRGWVGRNPRDNHGGNGLIEALRPGCSLLGVLPSSPFSHRIR